MYPRIIHAQIKYAIPLSILIVIMALLAGYMAVQLEIDPSFSSLVPKDSEFNTNDGILRNAFEQNDGLVIITKIDRSTTLTNAVTDLREQTQYYDQLKENLNQSQYVVSMVGPTYDDHGYLGQLFIGLNSPDDPDALFDITDELTMLASSAGTPPGVEVIVTGLPAVLNRVVTLLIVDNLVTLLFTLALIFVILYWFSRDFVFAAVTTSMPVLTLTFLGAAMVFFDIPVTLTLAAVGVLALGLGADYSIHIANHYIQHKKKGHEKALFKTMEELRLPVTASFVTTLGGFTALMLGVSPSSQAQGTVLVLAIAIIYLVSFFVFPVAFSLLHNYMNPRPRESFQLLQKKLIKLANIQAKYPKTVLTIIGVITIIMVVGASQVEFSTSNSNWIDDSDPVSQTFREVNYALGESTTITLILTATQGDLRNAQVARDVQTLITKIENIPNVDRIVSPYDNLELDTNQIINQIDDQLFNADYTLTRINIVSQDLQQNDAGKSAVYLEIKELVEQTPIYNTQVSYYGDVVRFDELGDNLQRDTGVTTLIGLVLVFTIASIIYRSLKVGIIALAPVIIAVIWAVGLMGFIGVPFTSLSTGLISLVLGIGVDFCIHLVDGIKRRNKMPIDKAIAETLDGTGSSIMLASMTTLAGFWALTFASLLGVQRLGWALVFAIIASFFVAISFVPAVMSLGAQRLKKEASKHKQ